MPFEIGEAVNGAAEWLCSSTIVSRVMSNSIFSALLITALAAVVIMGIYYQTSVKDGGWKCGIRVALYSLIVISAVVFVHHYALSRAIRDESRLTGIRERFSSIHGGGSIGMKQHPVPADIYGEQPLGRTDNVSQPPPQPYEDITPLDIQDAVLPNVATT